MFCSGVFAFLLKPLGQATDPPVVNVGAFQRPAGYLLEFGHLVG